MLRGFGTFIVLMSLFSGSQVAQAQSQLCPTGQPRIGGAVTLEGILNGRLACGEEIGGTDQWQEEHRPGGELFELARGPNHPVDPSRVVGTWSAEPETSDPDGPELVCYNYSGQEFCFGLYGDIDGEVTYCTVEGVAVATATLESGASGPDPCGFLSRP